MTEEKTQMVDLLKASKQKPTIIKNHSKKGFLVDKKLYNHSIIINNFCVLKWDLNNNVIQESDFYFLEGQEKFPELLLIGVGKKINDPFFNIRSKMSKLSIPVEIMSTSSACRTWNVLLCEGRNLLACIKNEY